MPQIYKKKIKTILYGKTGAVVREKVKDCKDGGGLQFIKFDLVLSGHKNKIASRVEFYFFF